MIESLFKDQTVSWVRIVNGINEYVTETTEEIPIENVQLFISTRRPVAKAKQDRNLSWICTIWWLSVSESSESSGVPGFSGYPWHPGAASSPVLTFHFSDDSGTSDLYLLLQVSQMKNLSRETRPGSSPLAWILPQSCYLLIVLVSSSPSYLEQFINLEFLAQQVDLKWADVEQLKKIVPFATCEISFGQ